MNLGRLRYMWVFIVLEYLGRQVHRVETDGVDLFGYKRRVRSLQPHGKELLGLHGSACKVQFQPSSFRLKSIQYLGTSRAKLVEAKLQQSSSPTAEPHPPWPLVNESWKHTIILSVVVFLDLLS